MRYTVKDVVCDYGVYEDDRLLVILNDAVNAKLIADILNSDLKKKRYSTILEDLNNEISMTKEELVQFVIATQLLLNDIKEELTEEQQCLFKNRFEVFKRYEKELKRRLYI